MLRSIAPAICLAGCVLAGCVRPIPAGALPKYATGRATYWTAVGVPGAAEEALVNEEGMVEVAAGRFSLEPFVEVDGRLVTWADVACEQRLVDGDLPMPVVTWRHPAFTLEVSVLADGTAEQSEAWVRYRLVPAENEASRVRLVVAVRPRQVLPPWQNLNVTGGAGRIDRMRLAGSVLEVDDRRIAALPAPLGLGGLPWRGGEDGAGALRWPVGTGDVVLVAGLRAGAVTVPAPGDADRVGARVRQAWRGVADRVSIRLPAAAGDAAEAVRATLGWILVDRDGPAIKPGPRNYARSWIRDGAVTTTALLMLGHAVEAREFLEWYATKQLPGGRVPCCVDDRGADPTPEHDSEGEFVTAVAEYWRFTHDRRTTIALWPHVRAAAEHILRLRAMRAGAAFADTPMAGLVPESISHEGYAKRAVHSYWDDFFALRGLADAAALADVVGETSDASRFATAHAAFARALSTSIARVIRERGLDYVPASVELADFDPTSTAAAVTVAQAESLLPAATLDATFTRYVREIEAWRAGRPNRDAYTPYEARNADALVRLGRREDAYTVLRFVLDGQRPRAWHVWPEVVAADAGAPRFLGDMPHGWGGATVVHAIRTMLAYERDRDAALVLAGGVPGAWLDGGEPVTVEKLPTHVGRLSYELARIGPRVLRVRIGGGLRVPAGGIVVAPPLGGALAGARVNGRAVRPRSDGTVRVDRVPAVVEMEEAS